MTCSPSRRGLCVLLAAVVAALAGCGDTPDPETPAQDEAPGPLHVIVMDPLCLQLACDCVGGYAQRRYDLLSKFLAGRLGRDVKLAYTESLESPNVPLKDRVDLVIGKFSVVQFDAAAVSLPVKAIAMLTGKDGKITQTGLFVVRSGDKAKSIEDLKGRKVLFGPV